VNALIGHLALTNYGRTDLKDVLSLSDHYGSVPLLVPVSGEGISNSNQLYSDQYDCVMEFKYSPHWPEVTPIEIEMELLDEDILSGPSLQLFTGQGLKHLDNVVEQIAQQVNFLRNLLLITRVKLNIPRKVTRPDLCPKIARMTLGWPTITSFRKLHLFIENMTPDREIPFTYNPLNRSLEWTDIQMHVIENHTDNDFATYVSNEIFLLVDQPGELYQQQNLEGTAEIEIPGLLLSRLRGRLYDGVGNLAQTPDPETVTYIKSAINLILDDAFSTRTRSPYEHLYFDEVIPDQMRIADIKTALVDRGFRILEDQPLPPGHDQLKHFILAQRPEGPEALQLWVFLEGKRYETERQTQVPGGQTYTSTFESGELKLYMRGEYPGDSRVLIQEMNALQMALRDRFERLRAKR